MVERLGQPVRRIPRSAVNLVSVVEVFGILCVALVTSASAQQDSGPATEFNGQATVEVDDCRTFRAALAAHDTGPTEIIISGVFRCEREEWGPAVEVRRNLTVRGTEQSGVLPAIDWADNSKVVISGRGTQVAFERLVFLQDEMGIGGLHITFFASKNVSIGLFEGVVMGVRSCPEPINSFKNIVHDLIRPASLPGEQRVTEIGLDSLLINDVGIRWGQRGSIWRICNSIFECGINTPRDPLLIEHLRSTKVMLGCSESEQMLEPSGGVGEEFSLRNTLIFVGVAFACGVGLISLVACYAFWRRRTLANWSDKELEELSTGQSTDKGKRSVASIAHFGSWNLHLSDVDIESPLGRGGFGKVYKGAWQGTTVAVKIIEHNDRLLQTNIGEPFEAYLSKHISHPNVVQTYHISTKEANDDTPDKALDVSVDISSEDLNEGGGQARSSSNELFTAFDGQGGSTQGGGDRFETWIVLEYCDRGSLAKAISAGVFTGKGPGCAYNMQFVLRTALEVAGAMNYLHSMRIIHADLKPRNVLLKGDGSDARGFICKVGDFGLSRYLAEDTHIETFTYGTVTHMPPELLQGGMLTPAADVYAFGILLWELLSGSRPYPGQDPREIILAVVNDAVRPIIPDDFPEKYSEVIRSCWQQSYEARPTFTDIIDRLRVLLTEVDRKNRQKSGKASPDKLRSSPSKERKGKRDSPETMGTVAGRAGTTQLKGIRSHLASANRMQAQQIASANGRRIDERRERLTSNSWKASRMRWDSDSSSVDNHVHSEGY